MSNMIDRIREAPAESLLAALVILVGFTSATAVILAPAPFLHDYAEWVYQARILSLKLTDPEQVEAFILYPYPVPYLLVQYVMAGLHLVLPPIVAGKAFIIFYLVASYAVFFAFVRRYVQLPQQRLLAWSLLVCVAGYSSFFWYGFIGYQFGLLVLLGFLTVYRPGTGAVMVALFSLLAFFTHATVFIQLGLLVVLAVLFCGYPVRHLLALAPSGLVAGWFLVGRYLGGTDMGAGDSVWNSLLEALVYKTGMVTMHGPFKNFLQPDGTAYLEQFPGLYWLGVWANLFAVLGLGMTFLLAYIQILRTSTHGSRLEASNDTRLLIMYAGSLVVIYLFAPLNFFGLVHPGGRLILPFFCVSVAVVATAGRPLPRAIVAVVVIVTLATVVAYFGSTTRVGSIPATAVIAPGEPPPEASRSVLAFNEWSHRNTRYSYYNYRIYAFANRYEQLREERYSGLSFRTGPIANYLERSANTPGQ